MAGLLSKPDYFSSLGLRYNESDGDSPGAWIGEEGNRISNLEGFDQSYDDYEKGYYADTYLGGKREGLDSLMGLQQGLWSMNNAPGEIGAPRFSDQRIDELLRAGASSGFKNFDSDFGKIATPEELAGFQSWNQWAQAENAHNDLFTYMPLIGGAVLGAGALGAFGGAATGAEAGLAEAAAGAGEWAGGASGGGIAGAGAGGEVALGLPEFVGGASGAGMAGDGLANAAAGGGMGGEVAGAVGGGELAGGGGLEEFLGGAGGGGEIAGGAVGGQLAEGGVWSSIMQSMGLSGDISMQGLAQAVLGGGASGMGRSPFSSALSLGSGIYGLMEQDRLRKQALLASKQENPFGDERALYAQKLRDLYSNPSAVQNLPGYQAGLQAIERRMASQGYLGSGNMMHALHEYGGKMFDSEADRLATLAGAKFSPSGGNLRLTGNIAANTLAGQSLASIGYGVQDLWKLLGN